jgi:hypothetical protein
LRANAAIEQAFYGHMTVDEAIREIEAGTADDFKADHFPTSITVPTPVPGRHPEDD